VVENGKRVEWIDVARGLGILLVILGHTMTSPIRFANGYAFIVYKAIYFFHMPFMFYLSGRTFGMFRKKIENYSFVNWTKKKGRTLMLPYIIYGLLVYIVFFIANSLPGMERIMNNAGYGKQSFVHWLKGMITVYGEDLYSYHLWFVYALFVMNIISFTITKYFTHHRYILLVVSIAFLCLRVIYPPINFWGIINLVMKCYFWFVIGSYVDFSKIVKYWYVRIYMGISLVYMCLMSIEFVKALVPDISLYAPIKWSVEMFTCYKNALPSEALLEPVKWVADMGIILFFVQVSLILRGTIKRFFSYTGRNSFVIYLFHQPFVASGFGAIMFCLFLIPIEIVIPVIVLLCYVVPLLIMKLLDTKYLSFLKPFLLGTPRKKRV